jgi:SAM-dependent methyltransferase
LTGIALLYDRLSRWVLLADRFGGSRRTGPPAMHKTLAEPGAAPRRRLSPHHVDLAVLDALGPLDAPAVLDVGCGFGASALFWRSRVGGRFDGLTLSRVQLRTARRWALRLGAADDCRFHLRSFLDPLPGPWDVVLSIESLVHSPDLAATFKALAAVLGPGGRLAMVEDMPADGLSGPAAAAAAALARHWGGQPIPTEGEFRAALRGAGLTLLAERDLTALVDPRPPGVLDREEARFSRLRRLPLPAVATVVDAYLGGIALERLYLMGAVRYRLLVAGRA